MQNFVKRVERAQVWRLIPPKENRPAERSGHSFHKIPNSFPETFILAFGTSKTEDYFADIHLYDPHTEKFQPATKALSYSEELQKRKVFVSDMIAFWQKDPNPQKLRERFGENFDTSWIISSKDDQQRMKALERQVEHRAHHVSVITKNQLFVFGGKNTLFLNDLLELDLRTMVWRRLDISSNSKAKPSQRYGASGCFYDGQIFIFGGYDSHGFTCNDMWGYSIQNQHWTQIISASAPPARYYHSAVVRDDQMIMGFGRGDSGALSDLWMYHFRSNAWEQLPQSAIPPRWGHTFSLDASHDLLVHAGRNAQTMLGDLWHYHFASKTASPVGLLGDFPSTRSQYAADFSLALSSMIVFGGIDQDRGHVNDTYESWDQSSLSGLNEMPFDIGPLIFRHLPSLRDLNSCSRVCKRWYDILMKFGSLWRYVWSCLRSSYEERKYSPVSYFSEPTAKELIERPFESLPIPRAAIIEIYRKKAEFDKQLLIKLVELQKNQQFGNLKSAKNWEDNAIDILAKYRPSGTPKIPANIKVVYIGANGVGKTSMEITFWTGTYPEEYVPTCGCGPLDTHLLVRNRPVRIVGWDTAGGDEYDRLRPLAYPGVDVFFIMFNIASRSSFELCHTKWVHEITHYSPGVPYLLVGTKIDLRKSNSSPSRYDADINHLVTKEEGQKMASLIGAVHYLEISSREKIGLDHLFEFAAVLGEAAKHIKGEKSPTHKHCLLQ